MKKDDVIYDGENTKRNQKQQNNKKATIFNYIEISYLRM